VTGAFDPTIFQWHCQNTFGKEGNGACATINTAESQQKVRKAGQPIETSKIEK
jgi:hypothetical protein